MKYVCSICGYVYDDAEQKVPFSELPDDWKCPLCGAAKSDFKPQNDAPAAPEAETVTPREDVELEHLTPGQMSALCSNLARGCEKQYKADESALFKQLADYFASITPAVEDATVLKVAQNLKSEVDAYAQLSATAAENGDRGAQRVCVWGEKVTRMLSSLVGRYLQEGDKMLEDTDIWVCTVCGFVYIGKQAPEICPVCKVPAWKFEKINGR